MCNTSQKRYFIIFQKENEIAKDISPALQYTSELIAYTYFFSKNKDILLHSQFNLIYSLFHFISHFMDKVSGYETWQQY